MSSTAATSPLRGIDPDLFRLRNRLGLLQANPRAGEAITWNKTCSRAPLAGDMILMPAVKIMIIRSSPVNQTEP